MARKSPSLFPQPAAITPAAAPYATRAQLSAIYHERFGLELSPRTLERWPLAWRTVNGRAITCVDDFIAEAQRRIDTAPVIMGGRTVNRAA